MTEMGQQPAVDDAKQIRRKRFRIFAAILLLVALAGGGWWLSVRGHETTDDAFIDSEVVGLSPEVAGRVIAVYFKDNDVVKAGDLMVELDPRDYQATLAAAQANLDAAVARRQGAQANLELTRVTSGADFTRAESALRQARQNVDTARSQAEAAKADAERADADQVRYRDLFTSRNASKQRLDQAVADARTSQSRWRAAQSSVQSSQSQVAQSEAQLRSAGTSAQQVALKEADLALAVAGVEQAEAALLTAQLNLSYTKVMAPQAGRVTRKAVAVGDTIQRNQTLTQLVAGTPWVVANFKETQLTRMRPGQKVVLSIDAYPEHALTGTVESIQPGTGARFSLLPAENATGNYIKVVQRVPVKIVFDDAAAAQRFLALGMSVVPDVDVSHPAP
jgi:membrane fusion protein (multidrug efflux system)